MSNFAPAVDNAVKLIEKLADEKEPVGVSELSRKLGINKNMIFRILNSLEQCGWVHSSNHPDKKYQLSLRLFKVASKALGTMSLSNVATPFVYDLWKKTGECTYLAIKSDDKITYIQHLDSIGNVRVAGTVGGTYDLYCSAPGKIILAHSDDEFVLKYVSRKFKKNTENTLTTKKELLAEIEKVKVQGFATDNEEFGKGILCVSAPIFDYTNSLVGAVGCSVSTVNYTREDVMANIKPLVTETAEKISMSLGYTE